MNDFGQKLRDMPINGRPCINCRYVRKEYFKDYKQDAAHEEQYRYHCDWIKTAKLPIHTSINVTDVCTWITPKQVEGPHDDVFIECPCFEHK